MFLAVLNFITWCVLIVGTLVVIGAASTMPHEALVPFRTGEKWWRQAQRIAISLLGFCISAAVLAVLWAWGLGA